MTSNTAHSISRPASRAQSANTCSGRWICCRRSRPIGIFAFGASLSASFDNDLATLDAKTVGMLVRDPLREIEDLLEFRIVRANRIRLRAGIDECRQKRHPFDAALADHGFGNHGLSAV